jgi:prepilin-type N-terminal cleavage/methylation domain-containing protein
MTRRGFTLIELMLALVISSVVITLAYGAVRAGTDTGERAGRVRAGVQARAAARELLADALRHALPGVTGGSAVFELTDSIGSDGLPHDRLRFVTRGVLPPFGAGESWRVRVFADSGAVIDAVTAIPREEGRYHAELAGVRGLDVRVLPNGAGAPWRDVWDEVGRSPKAVSLSFVGADGRTDGPPLVVRLGLERGS